MSKKSTGLWPTPKASRDGISPKTLQMVKEGKAEASLDRVVLMEEQEAAPTASRQLTLLPGDSLANLTVSPGSEEAQKTTATSGQNISALLKKSSRDTSLLRTFLESSPPISTRCYLTWKVKATPARRSIFQLSPSMPSTDENASLLLPTASAWDGRRGPAREYDPKSKSQKDRNLNTFARVHPKAGMWPTPRAQMTRGTTEDRGKYNLEEKVGQSKGNGQLNPMWVEWLMGFPLGWTDLEDSETP